jgi:hypothetical protein
METALGEEKGTAISFFSSLRFQNKAKLYFPVQFSGHTQRNAVNIRAVLEIS